MAARARDNEVGVPWGLVERDGYVYRQDTPREESQLLAEDGPDYVVYWDTRYAVTITDEQFHEPVYRATIEPVASSPEQMETILRAQVVDARVTQDILSMKAQEVLRQARREGYSEAHPYSSGYQDVLQALHEWAYLDGNVQKGAFQQDHGTGTILYDGEYADYRLRFRSESDQA